MKIIKRSPNLKFGKSVVIFPDLSVDPNMTVNELFGPSSHIRVSVKRIEDDQVELGFILPGAINVLKEEVLEPAVNVEKVEDIVMSFRRYCDLL